MRNPEKNRVNGETGFQRAQLLQPFALLERRWRQCDEFIKRGACIAVNADMVIKRAIARRGCGAGEIKSFSDMRLARAEHGFHHIRIIALGFIGNFSH